MIDNQLCSFHSYIYKTAERVVVKEETNEYSGRRCEIGYLVFASNLVLNLIRINGDSHCTVIELQYIYRFAIS
jgi:hypothetical protein